MVLQPAAGDGGRHGERRRAAGVERRRSSSSGCSTSACRAFSCRSCRTPDEARRAVAATRYPPEGIRGVAVADSRQPLRTRQGLRHAAPTPRSCVDRAARNARRRSPNLEAIAAVDGDRRAVHRPERSRGRSRPSRRQRAIPTCARRSTTRSPASARPGKFAGILAPVEADARHWLERGCLFVAVGSDVGLLARQSEALAREVQGMIRPWTTSTDRTAHDAKVSWRLLPLIIVIYFVAYIDRTNVGVRGDQHEPRSRVHARTSTAGAPGSSSSATSLFEVPSNVILHRVGARVWIARIMVTWGIVSGLMAFVTGADQLSRRSRFLLGVAEAGFFPGRAAVFHLLVPGRRIARA